MQNKSIVVDVQGKIFKTCLDENFFYPGSDLKLALTLTLSLTLALGLGLSLGKTISFENLKPNTKDQYGRRCPEKNLYNLIT